MTYYCNNCKDVFDADDARLIRTSNRVGDWIKVDEDYVCPHCGSCDCEEAVECPSCGEYISKEESYGGYCENCVNEAATFENLMECDESDDNKEKVAINETLLAVCQEFKIDIEAVLKAAINESVSKEKLNAYCCRYAKDTYDTEYFMEWVEKNRG